MRGEVYGSAGEGQRATAAHAACRDGRDCRARGLAHPEHQVKGCDAGGVEAQRLVELKCILPRVERGACGAERGIRVGRWGAADDRSARSVQEGLDCRLGVGHGEERTMNIRYMAVTLEVSKLSGWLNADAACRESKGEHIPCG